MGEPERRATGETTPWRRRVLAPALGVALLMAAVVASQTLVRPVQEVHVAATPYGFVPPEVHVRAGIPTRLTVTGVDADPGLEIRTLVIQRAVQHGRAATVEFAPEIPGRYQFRSTIRRGLDSSEIVGVLVVE